MKRTISLILAAAALVVARTNADPFFFTTGTPDGRMATASRPPSLGKIEIESADDFILTNSTEITSATFTGLVPIGLDLATVGEVNIEIYRVFPLDSGPFDGMVPTRTNSPSDVEFTSRSSLAGGGLSFSTTLLNASFTAANSILNGINKSLTPATGGEGPVTGQEVQFSVTFTNPLNLPADHYFFVPQVELLNGNFYWLSTASPPLFTGDLQAWIRNANLAPDWLREGTDIVGGTTPPRFNEAFSLTGVIVPDSGSTALLISIAAAVLFYLKQRIRA